MSLLQQFVDAVKKWSRSRKGSPPARRAWLGLEELETREVPAVLSPHGIYSAAVLGAPGVESVRVTRVDDGSVVFQSGGFQRVVGGEAGLVWSPNDLELGWVQQNGPQAFSYDWAGVLPTPTTVPSFTTAPTGPFFAPDGSSMQFVTPTGLPVRYTLPTTPPHISITGVPSTLTAGSPIDVKITAPVNSFQNLPYNGAITLTTSDGQPVLGLISPVVLTTGVGHATIRLNRADTLNLIATETNGFSGRSQVFTVNPGAPASFVVSTPARATAGVGFWGTIKAEDQFGNLITNYASNTVALQSSDGQAVTPSLVSLTSGQATALVTLPNAGTIQLTASDWPLGYRIMGTSSAITVSNPVAALIVRAPGTVTAGSPFSITITAVDKTGAALTDYTGTAFLTSSDGQAVVPSSVTLTNGTATVSNVILTRADALRLVASIGNISGSSALTVRPGTVAKFSITVPNKTIVNTPFQIKVKATDVYGNLVPGWDGKVTLKSSDGQAVTPGSVTLSEGSGTASITLGELGTIQLQASAGSLTGSAPITVSAGPPAKVTVSTPNTVTAGTGFWVTITATDASDNPVTSTATLTSSDGQKVFSGLITVVNGTARVYVALNIADTLTLTAKVGPAQSISASITVNPARAVTYLVSPPAGETAGSAFSMTVTAKDAFGNTVTGYNGSVPIYSSDGQKVFGGPIAVVNGVGMGQISLNIANRITLTAVGGGIAGTSGLTTVFAAEASSVKVYAPAVVQAGSAFTVTVVARDRFGNGCTGLASLSTSDGQGGLPTWVSLVNGAGSAVVTLDRAATLTLTASLNGVVGTSNSMTVNPSGLASFVVSAPGTATAGSAFPITVTARDAFGNTLTGFTGSVALLSSDGQAVNPSVLTLTNGVGSGQVTLNKADTTALSVFAHGIMGSSDNIQVSSSSPQATPGKAVTFLVSPPASETAGSAFKLTVTAKDASGNTVTSYNGSVTIYSSDGQKVFGGLITLVNGVGKGQITLNIANRVTLTAVGGGLAGTSGLSTIRPAAPNTIKVYAPAVVQAGSAFTVTVVARDRFGNGCTGLASLSTSDGQGGLPTWVSLVNGAGSAVVTLDRAATLTLTASLNGVVGTSNSMTVNPSGLASFVVSAPGTATAGSAFLITVTARDAFGNTLTGFTGQIALLCSDGESVQPNVMTLTKGIGSVNVTLNKAQTVGLTAFFNGVLGVSDEIRLS